MATSLPPGYVASCYYTPTLPISEVGGEYPGYACTLVNSTNGETTGNYSGYNSQGTLTCTTPGRFPTPCQTNSQGNSVCPINGAPCYGITNAKAEFSNPAAQEPLIFCLPAESYRNNIPNIADTYQGTVCVGEDYHYRNLVMYSGRAKAAPGVLAGSPYCSPNGAGVEFCGKGTCPSGGACPILSSSLKE